jgi:beta-phosphoglucomutase-like phosphatase (HAD superfamily)
MSIKVVVLDVSNTTLKPNLSVQPGIVEFLGFCRDKGLKIAFVTNTPQYKKIIQRMNIEHDIIVTPEEVNNKKPSPEFIYFIEKKLAIPRDRFIYTGDTDKTDAYCAAHASVLYFCSTWANQRPVYGIPVSSPEVIQRLIRKYLLKDDCWYFKLETSDARGKNIRICALLDCASE